MSTRTWKRKQAHRKADMLGIKHQNKMRYFNGKPMGTWFSNNWKRIGSVELPSPKKNNAV